MFKLVVGLGNPGSKYDGTRHNIGFEVSTGSPPAGRAPGSPEVRGATGRGRDRLPARPAPQARDLHEPQRPERRPSPPLLQARAADLLVVCDDLNLPLGKLRIRKDGSDGGQKGLRDISAQLGTEDYARLRIGIGDRGPIDAADFVLSRFRPAERSVVEDALIEATQAVAVWVAQGADAAMNRFNGPLK